MEENTKSKGTKLGNIWLTVCLLAVLVLASAALLGTLIKEYASGEKNVISVVVDGNAIRDQYDDDSLPLGAVPDSEVSWETETTVDLFKNTYTNADGTVTVESSDGRKVIAPGTSNTYDFTLKNTGNISIDYTLAVEGVFELSDENLPFFVRLRRGEKWISGGEDSWVHVDELEDAVEKGTLPRDKAVTYTFEWMWPYESDDEHDVLIGNLNDTLIEADNNDTSLGDIAAQVQADFHLTIGLTSVVTPGSYPIYGDGSPILTEFLVVTVSAGLIIGSGIWLILIFWRRKLYFTGIIVPAFSGEVKLGKQTAEAVDGRFVFPKARFGKRTLAVGEVGCDVQFKSRKVEEGVRFEYEDSTRTVVVVDRKIRALELRVTNVGGVVMISIDGWAAIDKKHNVHKTSGVVPPIEKRNSTPNGLSVNERNEYYISDGRI